MGHKQKVLIVDDEPRNQRIICETLEDQMELKLASSGEEALAVIDDFLPDLVLLDIMMPGIDGYQVCKTIKSKPNLSLTKVILVSGKAMIDERLKGYEAGADDYMTKPFVPEELLAKATVFLKLTAAEKNFVELNASLDRKVQERTQQLMEAEAKLVAAAKMSALGEMAGGIAHEINTPLGTITLIASQVESLLTEESPDREALAQMVKIIDTTVHRISSIIQGLRTFSRDGSKDRFHCVPFKQVLDNTLSLCNEKLRQQGVEILVEPFAEDLKIQCRSVQISQVLLNLINNARDAVLPLDKKWIKISAVQKGQMVQISITDSGSGISPEARDKIFHPFFTTKEIGKGTGLGLSISKGIIDAHKGSISLDPQSTNTCFVLLLPAGETDAVESAA